MEPTIIDGKTLDPKVLKVMGAIKQVESGGDYNAIGDNGSSAGAFQWNNNKVKLQPGQVPARFYDHAKEAGVQVNDFSVGSQNKVAYGIMEKWKNDGLTPEEIAAKWNGATKDPTTGRLTYVNPDYGVKFRNAIQSRVAAQPQAQPEPTKPEDLPFHERPRGLVKSLLSAPATMVARPFQAIAGLAGVSNEQIDKWTEANMRSIGLGNLIAPTPKTYKDVWKDVGRGLETAAWGIPVKAPITAGAVFGGGMALQQEKGLGDWEFYAYTIGGGVAGKALDKAVVIGKPLFDRAGKVIGKITPQILDDVARGGAKAVEDFAKRNKLLPTAVSEGLERGIMATENVLDAPFRAGGRVVGGRSDEAIIAARQKVLQDLEEKYTTTLGRLAEENPGAAGRVARSNVLAEPGVVTSEGKIVGAKTAADAFGERQIGAGNKALETLLQKEGAEVEIALLRREMRRTARESITQAGERQQALKAIEREIAALRVENPSGRVKLVDLHRAKTQLYQDAYKGLYANPGVNRRKRQMGRAYKETIEKYSKENVRGINRQLEQLYADKAYIGSLQGKTVGSGKLGGMVRTGIQSAVGFTVGGAIGGVGGAIGGGLAAKAIGERLAGRAARKTFGRPTKKPEGMSKVLREAVSKAEKPQKLLPAPSDKAVRFMPAPKPKPSPISVKATKSEPVQDPKTGRFKRTYISGEKGLTPEQIIDIKKNTPLKSPQLSKLLSVKAKEVKEGKLFGFTSNLDGTEYVGKDAVATLQSETVSFASATQENINKILAKKAKLYGNNKYVKVGIFEMPNGQGVSIDINIVTPNRTVAERIARINNQDSYWDSELGKVVKTGGTGVQKLSDEEIKVVLKSVSTFNKDNPAITKMANAFFKSKGKSPKRTQPLTFAHDEKKAMEIADAYEAMKDQPNNLRVRKAYKALADETLEQYRFIEKEGYKIEPWTGKGEPYKNSGEMVDDVLDNKHLYFFTTEEGFGNGTSLSHPLLKDTGIVINGHKMLYNDIFRVVHDIFGHAKVGNRFGALGEENAWRIHSQMYSDDARRALTSETRGQNSWVNYGKQMRDKDGNLLRPGDKGYLTPPERSFADQKTGLLPDRYVFEGVRGLGKTKPTIKPPRAKSKPQPTKRQDGSSTKSNTGLDWKSQKGSLGIGAIASDIKKGVEKFKGLFSEAKKYKSADEFVKAQGTPMYHATRDTKMKEFDPDYDYELHNSRTDVGQIRDYETPYGRVFMTNDLREAKAYGQNVLEVFYEGKPKIKTIKTGDTPPSQYFDNEYNWGNLADVMENEFYDILKLVDNNGKATYISSFLDKLKTRSQLEDIWKQANKKSNTTKAYNKMAENMKKEQRGSDSSINLNPEAGFINFGALFGFGKKKKAPSMETRMKRAQKANELGYKKRQASESKALKRNVDKKEEIKLRNFWGGRGYNVTKDGLKKKKEWWKDQRGFANFGAMAEDIGKGIKAIAGKGLSADDIMKQHPDINLKRDVSIKDVRGTKKVIPEGEALTPYELKGNKVLLQDGETYIVSKNQWQNIKGQSISDEAIPFAPEMKDLTETVRGAGAKTRGDASFATVDDIERQLNEQDILMEQDLDGGFYPVHANGELLEYDNLPPQQQRLLTAFEEARNELDNVAGGGTETKYSNHTLPGGENYREIIVTAPNEYAEALAENTRLYRTGKISLEQYKRNQQFSETGGEGFISSHWPEEPNPLFHSRVNERTFKKKNDTLFSEESQSDWAKDLRNAAKAKAEGEGLRGDDAKARTSALFKQAIAGEIDLGVSVNPLLDNWLTLAIKRELQEAVDGGHRYYAWINGAQTSERYKLSTQVEKVQWRTSPSNNEITEIKIAPKDGSSLIDVDIDKNGVIKENTGVGRDWEGKRLDEVLGKGMADSIMSKQSGTLEGEGLNFGGEWANNLYDKQKPNTVKKLTGAEVKKANFGLGLDDKSQGFTNIYTFKTDQPFSEMPKIDDPRKLKVGDIVFKGVGQDWAVVAKVTDDSYSFYRGGLTSIPEKPFPKANLKKLEDKDLTKVMFDDPVQLQQYIELTPEVVRKIKGEAPGLKKPSGRQPY